jgi:hypothetical protein
VGIDTSGSSVRPPVDGQLVAPLPEVGDADEPGTLLDELGEADELDVGDFEDVLWATVVGPQAIAARIVNTTAAARIIFIRTSEEADRGP